MIICTAIYVNDIDVISELADKTNITIDNNYITNHCND